MSEYDDADQDWIDRCEPSCPHCAAALARAERAEDAADELTRCNATQFDVISSLTREVEGIRAELAQARAERDMARAESDRLFSSRGAIYEDWQKSCADLAASRATLRELVEAVGARDLIILGGGPGMIKARNRLKAALTRAGEEGKRDG